MITHNIHRQLRLDSAGMNVRIHYQNEVESVDADHTTACINMQSCLLLLPSTTG
jgi:hypothetical protein